MALFTSSQFAASAASGTDWRDTSKKILEELESIKTSGSNFNFGFLYITDFLTDNAESILNLFRSVLEIDHWVGTTGLGVCANGEALIDKPAISAMIGHFELENFCVFPGEDFEPYQIEKKLQLWLDNQDPMLVLIHGDPTAEDDPMHMIKELDQMTGGFLAGGLSSSRNQHMQFADNCFSGGVSGVAFSQNINVATTLSQGCKVIGQPHRITKGEGHIIEELDEEKAVSVFEQDLRSMTIKKIDHDPDKILIDEDDVPEEYQSLFKGEVHAAFPISGSDQNDYLVRNIMGIDPDTGSMAISQNIHIGESVVFVHRNADTVSEDLSKNLVELRQRVEKDKGKFEPKAALYVSCIARAFNEEEENAEDEMQLIQEIIGDIPLVGFYAGGEISNAQLYGYTGILTLFL